MLEDLGGPRGISRQAGGSVGVKRGRCDVGSPGGDERVGM